MGMESINSMATMHTERTLLLSHYYFDFVCLSHRRQQMAANLKLRHKVIKTIRNFLDAKDFLEVETPVLGRATPEGARDFLVPSRSEICTTASAASVAYVLSVIMRCHQHQQLVCHSPVVLQS